MRGRSAVTQNFSATCSRKQEAQPTVCGAVQQGGGGAFLRMFVLLQAHMTDVERVKTSAFEMMALLYRGTDWCGPDASACAAIARHTGGGELRS
jgi:hypothetical protein